MIKILLIDNFDSFTYNLVDYFRQLQLEVQVVRNDVSMTSIESLDFNAIVFSPGPGKPKDAGILMQLLDKYSNIKPILGICLGHQAIGEYFGWNLKKALYPMHGKTSEVFLQSHKLFTSLPASIYVMRYHSLIIEAPQERSLLIPIAVTSENEVMVVVHESLPITGFQFHPESILTREGLTLLKNWVSTLKK